MTLTELRDEYRQLINGRNEAIEENNETGEHQDAEDDTNEGAWDLLERFVAATKPAEREPYPAEDTCSGCGGDVLVYVENVAEWRHTQRRDDGMLDVYGTEQFDDGGGDDEHIQCRTCCREFELPADWDEVVVWG